MESAQSHKLAASGSGRRHALSAEPPRIAPGRKVGFAARGNPATGGLDVQSAADMARAFSSLCFHSLPFPRSLPFCSHSRSRAGRAGGRASIRRIPQTTREVRLAVSRHSLLVGPLPIPSAQLRSTTCVCASESSRPPLAEMCAREISVRCMFGAFPARCSLVPVHKW